MNINKDKLDIYIQEIVGILLVIDLILANTKFNTLQIIIEIIIITVLFIKTSSKFYYIHEWLLLLVLSTTQLLSLFYVDIGTFLLNFKLCLTSILILVYSRYATILPKSITIAFILNMILVLWQLVTGIYPFPSLAVGAAWEDLTDSRPLGLFINTHASAGFAAIYIIYLSNKKKFFGLDILLQFYFASLYNLIGLILQKASYFKLGRNRLLIFSIILVLPLSIIYFHEKLLDLFYLTNADIRLYSIKEMFDNIGNILSIDNYSFFPGSYSAYIERLNSKGLKTNEMEIISVMIKGGYVFGFSLFLSIFFRLRYFAIFFTFTIFHYGYITSAPLILFVILFFEKEIRINQFIKTTL